MTRTALRLSCLTLAAALCALCSQGEAKTAHSAMPVLRSEPYNDKNPFALIARGALPAYKIYEDRDVVAFLDQRPIEAGHVLVISRTSKARDLLEMEPAEIARLMAVVRRVGAAQVKALGVRGFTVLENNGLGQSTPQVHFHVIPRTTDGPLQVPTSVPPTPEMQKAMAEKLRAAFE